MSKIFDWDARKGTFIDSVSGKIGNFTAGEGGYAITNKGRAVYFDNANTYIEYDGFSLTNFSMGIWFRTGETSGDDMNPLGYGVGMQPFRIRNNDWYLYIAGKSARPYKNITDNQWHCLIIEKDSNEARFYRNNELLETDSSFDEHDVYTISSFHIGKAAGDFFDGYIQKVVVYDDGNFGGERESFYKDFLHSAPVETPIRNFSFAKPSDLSNEEGLVAAYNMIPSNGQKLVDISGNGRDMTNFENALPTKDGYKIKDGIISGYGDSIQIKSLKARFKVHPDSDAGLLISGIKWADGKVSSVRISNNYLAVSYNNSQETTYETDRIIEDDFVYNICINFNEDNSDFTVYINGEAVNLNADSTAYYRGEYLSFGDRTEPRGKQLDCEIIDVKFYDREITPQEAKAYHNKYARRPYLNLDFSNDAVGDTI